MELEQAIFSRRSVRKFKQISIDKMDLDTLAKAAIWAPTAGNHQPWGFICLTDQEMIQKIITVAPGLFGNPKAIICVCLDHKKTIKITNKDGREVSSPLGYWDCSMAAQNILLRACDLGLGSCVVASFNQDAVRELLEAPLHFEPLMLIILGYPDQTPKAPKRKTDVIFWEKYTGTGGL
jgi:nitroreductase